MSIAEHHNKLQTGYDQHIGIQMIGVKDGHVVLELPITPVLLNAGNILHGGVIASLLDQVIGLSIRTITEHRLVTVNLNVHYLAPAKEGDTAVATANVRHIGKHLATGDGEVRNRAGTLLAIASGTFKILSNERNEVKK